MGSMFLEVLLLTYSEIEIELTRAKPATRSPELSREFSLSFVRSAQRSLRPILGRYKKEIRGLESSFIVKDNLCNPLRRPLRAIRTQSNNKHIADTESTSRQSFSRSWEPSPRASPRGDDSPHLSLPNEWAGGVVSAESSRDAVALAPICARAVAKPRR
ncbi:hypothetical protein EVAR_56806_1 [Eumeta japonica]|uniref:Uncharacterized protein n=1 Tax=Eumeta variegata TaxID=151549 RepID=A0A4C1Y361_EUMVA|nr:hypothetical protein EVAR_56806_1 [Eumeta japonica]